MRQFDLPLTIIWLAPNDNSDSLSASQAYNVLTQIPLEDTNNMG